MPLVSSLGQIFRPRLTFFRPYRTGLEPRRKCAAQALDLAAKSRAAAQEKLLFGPCRHYIARSGFLENGTVRIQSRFATAFVCLAMGAPAPAQVAPPLPTPTGRPLAIDFGTDPVLRLRRQQAGFDRFRAAIAAAVENHPGTAESAAAEDEALGVLEEARSAQLPTVDLNVTSYRVVARDFSMDPFNIIERSRPVQRTDALLSVQQVLFDFGATARRITAAGARLRAAGADLEAAADRVAVNAVAAWYDVFAYRALVALTEAFVASQRDLRGAVEARIRQGVSAE